MLLLISLMHYKEVDVKKWQELKRKDQTFVTLFFAPWCGHCKAFGPEYQKAGKKLTGVLDFVSIDCTAQQNQQLCGTQEIQGYPTIKIFNHNKGKKPEVYEGARTADDLSRWATGLQKKPFIQLRGLDPNTTQRIPDEKDVLIMTTPSSKASTLAYKIAKQLSGKAAVFCHVAFDEAAVASYSDSAFKEHLSRVDRPQLVVRRQGQFHKYEGENQGNAIEAWISEIFG